MLIVCPSCRSKLRLADNMAGRNVRCPSCNTVTRADAKPTAPRAALEPDDDPPLAEETPLRRKQEIEIEVDDDEDVPRRRLKKKRSRSNVLNMVLIAGTALVVLAGVGGVLWWFIGPEMNSNLTMENIQKIQHGMTLEEAEQILGKARIATERDVVELNEMTRAPGDPPIGARGNPAAVKFRGGLTKYMWRNKNLWFLVDVDDQSKKILGTQWLSHEGPRRSPPI